MEKIDKVSFEVTYNNKDISADLSKNLLSINYKDNTEGKPDELILALENVDAFWENEWYPEKGAKISCKLGIDVMMDCGTFEIDEIEITSMPDVVQIKAISAPITGKLRTMKSTAHENTTLKDIVNKIASDNGLTVQGEIANLSFVRITQNKENDLAFLKRLADRFGYYFSIRGMVLNFNSRYEIIKNVSVASIDRSECIRYSIRDKSAKTFRKANISSFNPKAKKVISFSVMPEVHVNGDGISFETIKPAGFASIFPSFPTSNTQPSGLEEFTDEGVGAVESVTEDALNMVDRVEDEAQAEAVGSAALLNNNLNQQEGSITMPGNILFVAGNNFQFTGIGKLSGKCHIAASEHNVAKNGFETTIEYKKVGLIELAKGKRKKAPVKKNIVIKVVK